MAETGGEVAGLIATHLVPRIEDDAPSCRIIGIVVAERHRRAGVATALVAAAEAQARAHGARRLDLSSGTTAPTRTPSTSERASSAARRPSSSTCPAPRVAP